LNRIDNDFPGDSKRIVIFEQRLTEIKMSIDSFFGRTLAMTSVSLFGLMLLVSCGENHEVTPATPKPPAPPAPPVIPDKNCDSHYLAKERRYGNSTAEYYYNSSGNLRVYTLQFDTQDSYFVHDEYFYGEDQTLDSVKSVFGGVATQFVIEGGRLKTRWRRDPGGLTDSVTMIYDNAGRVVQMSDFLLQQAGFQETLMSFQYPNDSTVRMTTYFRAAGVVDEGYQYRGVSTFILDGKKVPYPQEYQWLYADNTLFLSSNIVSYSTSYDPEPVNEAYQYDALGYPVQVGDADKARVYTYLCDPPQVP
jgi:hypothetical protein